MPKCIVDYCRNYAGMRKNYANIILHGFPTKLDRIKLWLRAIEQSGQRFDNLEEMAEKIYEGKKFDSYRVCSEHFTIQCYFVNGDKKTLKKESVPTVFANRDAVAQFARKHLNKRKKQEPLNTLAKKIPKTKPTELLKEPKKTQKVKNSQELAQNILNIALEIIVLLTGEDYIVVKKSCPQVKLDRRTLCSEIAPHSQILDWVNEHKLLELTENIIELLTEEEEDNIEVDNEASTDVEIENVPSPGVEASNTVHPLFLSSDTSDVETVIVQDVQESKCFQISTWTTISEANGTKKLVLREEANTQDGAAIHVQRSPAQIVEKPRLSGGGNLKVYTQGEPLPLKRVDQPPSDLYIHFNRSQCSSIKECPPSEGIIVPSDRVYMDKQPITSKRQNVLKMDVTGKSNHRQDSSTHITGGTQNLPSLDDDHLQYTSIVIDEEHLLPSQADLHIPNNCTPPVHPQCTFFIFKEAPYTRTHTSTAGDPPQITSGCIKGEPDSCGEQNLTQSTTHTSNTHCITYTIS